MTNGLMAIDMAMVYVYGYGYGLCRKQATYTSKQVTYGYEKQCMQESMQQTTGMHSKTTIMQQAYTIYKHAQSYENFNFSYPNPRRGKMF